MREDGHTLTDARGVVAAVIQCYEEQDLYVAGDYCVITVQPGEVLWCAACSWNATVLFISVLFALTRHAVVHRRLCDGMLWSSCVSSKPQKHFPLALLHKGFSAENDV